MKWINIADEGQPVASFANPYPTHMVRLLCVSGDKNWERIENGELRFFGRDLNRPNWVSPADQKPLENDAWIVTHYLSDSLDKIEGWPEEKP